MLRERVGWPGMSSHLHIRLFQTGTSHTLRGLGRRHLGLITISQIGRGWKRSGFNQLVRIWCGKVKSHSLPSHVYEPTQGLALNAAKPGIHGRNRATGKALVYAAQAPDELEQLRAASTLDPEGLFKDASSAGGHFARRERERAAQRAGNTNDDKVLISPRVAVSALCQLERMIPICVHIQDFSGPPATNTTTPN
eukprot:5851926-Pyramimonas_sp.AAC.1